MIDSPHIRPVPIHQLPEGAHFLWHLAARWHVFSVETRWDDGVLAKTGSHATPRLLFLHNQQWVGFVPSWLVESLQARTEASARPLLIEVVGRSMEPTLPLGCQIEVVPCEPGVLEVGDVVIWGHPRFWNTHRIRHIYDGPQGKQIVTRGDAMWEDDEPLSPFRLFGRIKQASHQGETWNPNAKRYQLVAKRRWWRATASHLLRML